MIDLELIQETSEVVTGHEPTGLILVLGAVAILMTCAWGFVCEYREAGFVVGIALVGGGASLMGRSVFLLTLVIGIALAVMLSVILANRRARKPFEALATVGFVIAVVSALLLTMNLLPQNEVTEEAPTEAAMEESAKAEDTIKNAVLDDYEVEVVDSNTCWTSYSLWSDDENSPEEDHELRARFAKQAVSQNPDAAPGIRLLTDEGVVGCYRVLYDNETGDTRLIVDSEDVDLPVPKTIEKD